VIISLVYLVVRCLLGCLMMLTQRQVSKDAELLVVRHEALLSRMEVEDLRLLAVAAVG
jgi:putative transposase